MEKKKIFCVLALVVSFCFICSTHSPAAAEDSIKIGIIYAMTGKGSALGVKQMDSAKFAVNEINAKGGIFVKEYNKKLPVKLVVADDESNAGKAGKAVERLIKMDRVDMLLGGFAAPFGVIPGCITAEKYKRYYHTSV